MTAGPPATSTYAYDAENRIRSGAGVTYTYNGDGERVAKSSGTLYWHGGAKDALSEGAASGALTYDYVFFNGKRVARVDLGTGAVHFYLSDHLGSATVMSNAAGSVKEAESDYYPYGVESVIVADTTANHYKFTGKERDSEDGLDYFGARFYSSALGRFLTPDWSATPVLVPYATLGNPQTLNLYSYVENNPITGTDPDGHAEQTTATASCTPGTGNSCHPQPTVIKLDSNDRPIPPPSPGIPHDIPVLNAPGPQYKTAEKASKTAIRKTNRKSVKEHREYAGRTVRNVNGTFGTTAPNPGTRDGSDNGPVPYGTVTEEIWHTHGGNDPGYDNEHFSEEDKRNARKEGVPTLVGTPGGTIRKYDPATGTDRVVGTTPRGEDQ